jgi:hypothetical protein
MYATIYGVFVYVTYDDRNQKHSIDYSEQNTERPSATFQKQWGSVGNGDGEFDEPRFLWVHWENLTYLTLNKIAYGSSIAKLRGYVSGELKEQMQVISVSTGAHRVWIQNPETAAFHMRMSKIMSVTKTSSECRFSTAKASISQYS